MEFIDTVNIESPISLLGNDLVVNEDSCNLSCHYCLTGQSNMKAEHENQLIFESPSFDEYASDSPLAGRLNMIVDRVNKKLQPPLIKLTGGEIFLVKGFMDFIEQMSVLHESVIVQTNAIPLTDDKIERLALLDNITIQISMDSSNIDGNWYRGDSPALHNKLLNRIESAIQSGLPVEIYGVLNDKSAPYLKEFVQWCAEFKINIPQLFPFPVRGPDSEKFQVRPDQYHYIEELQELVKDYPEVLPPQAYIDRLISFYKDGERTWQCHLPRLVLSTFDDGVSTPCPNIWFHNMGNLLEDQWESALEKVNRTEFYQLLLAERPRLDACKGCFTPWDTLSLYFDDHISLDELCRAPSYGVASIRQFLKEKKEEYKAEKAEKAASKAAALAR